MVFPPPDVGCNLLTFPPFAKCPQNNIQTHQSKHTEVQSRAGGEQVERETVTHLTTKGRLIHYSLYVLCIKKNCMRIKILSLIEPNGFEWCFQASMLSASMLIDWKSHSGQWLLMVTFVLTKTMTQNIAPPFWLWQNPILVLRSTWMHSFSLCFFNQWRWPIKVCVVCFTRHWIFVPFNSSFSH